MNVPARKNNSFKRILWTISLLTYFLLAFGYALYSILTQTGLCGYLIDLQMRHFGSADENLTMMITCLILFLSPVIPIILIGMLPSVWRKGKKSNEVTDPVFAHQSPRVPNPETKTLGWRGLLVIAALPTGIAAATCGIIWTLDQKDQHQSVYQIDLDAADDSPPVGAQFAVLYGKPRLDLRLGYREKGTITHVHSYTPLTASKWNDSQPVRFFLYSTQEDYSSSSDVIPSDAVFRNSLASSFSSRLNANALPTYIRKEFERRGIIVATPHYVLERMNFVEGRVPPKDPETYWSIVVLGLVISLLFLVLVPITLMRRRA